MLTLTNVGDCVQFQNTNETLSTSGGNYVKFVMTGKIAGSGNIQSMLNYIENCKDYCYCQMFHYCTSLTTAPELPATTLADCCYYYMFYNCQGLTSPPELPATTLAYSCYHYMFYNCRSLTVAPELPATTLADYCYAYMFGACTNLTVAPELPATNLADRCYQYMFNNCSNLTVAPELPATTLADYCYFHMFEGCTNLTVAPELPATTLANSCYHYMFAGCTSLTTAPELPATTLVGYCYYYMFIRCSKLNYIKVGFTSWHSYATSDWLNGVSSTGTFDGPSNLPVEFGTSRIPTGWDVPNAKNTILAVDQRINDSYLNPINYQIQYEAVPETLKPTFTIVEGSLPEGLTLDSATGIISGTSTTEYKGNLRIQLSAEDCESVTIVLSLTLHNNLTTENNLTANNSNQNYTVSQRSDSSANYAWKAMDGNESTYSRTQYASGVSDWWKIDFHMPVILKAFTLKCQNESSYGTYLEASNDDLNWIRIDSEKIPGSSTTSREYDIQTPYRYYRFISERTYYYIQFYEVKFQYQLMENTILADDQTITNYYLNPINYQIQYKIFPETLTPMFTIVEGSLPEGLTLDENTGIISGKVNGAANSTIAVKISADGVEDVVINITIKVTDKNYIVEDGITFYTDFQTITDNEIDAIVGQPLTLVKSSSHPIIETKNGVPCMTLDNNSYAYDVDASYWDTSLYNPNCTVSVWLYTPEFPSDEWQCVLCGEDTGSVNGNGCDMIINFKPTHINFDRTGHANINGGAYNINTWYHAVFTLNDSNKTSVFYVNGVNKGSVTRSYPQMKTKFVGIGCRYESKNSGIINKPSNISIAGLRIYNRVLSDSEIALLYNEYKNNIV